MIGFIDTKRSDINAVESVGVRPLALLQFRSLVAEPRDGSEHLWQHFCDDWAIYNETLRCDKHE